MKVFVTGIKGQLGHDVRQELLRRGHDVTGSDIIIEDGDIGVPLDITDGNAVMELIKEQNPDAVIHCAAWTDVDGAEDPESREQVYAVNADGTANIARAAREADAAMMYISTDYVFDGQGTDPWKPDDQNYAPLNYYGETKLAGEQAVREIMDRYFIVRTSWVFGEHGKNFVQTIIRAGRSHDRLRVINDQIGSPTYTGDLAVLLSDMIESDKYGTYHASNGGEYISWYDYACEILKEAAVDVEVDPVSTEEYGLSAAARPANSRLDKSKLVEAGFSLLPDWRTALKKYLKGAGL